MALDNMQIVATVNGQTISVADYQKQVRFTRWQYGLFIFGAIRTVELDHIPHLLGDMNSPYSLCYQFLIDPQNLGERVLDCMVEHRLASQYAAEYGIRVDENEVDKKLSDLLQHNWLIP